MAKMPAFQLYSGDWLKDPNLRRCSKAAKGVWIDMLCLMSECEDRGVLASGGQPWDRNEIAGAVGGDLAENLACIEELLRKGVACLTKLGAISNRRMVRDEEKRADNRNYQHTHRRKTIEINENSKTNVRHLSDPSSTSTSSSTTKLKTTTPQAAFILPDWVPVEPWEAFVKMRTKQRWPLSERAKTGIIRDLDRLRTIGNDIGEVLDRSEKNVWRGVFALPGPEPDRRNEPRFTPGPDRYKKPEVR